MFPISGTILALPTDLLQEKKGNLLAHWSTSHTRIARYQNAYIYILPNLFRSVTYIAI